MTLISKKISERKFLAFFQWLKSLPMGSLKQPLTTIPWKIQDIENVSKPVMI